MGPFGTPHTGNVRRGRARDPRPWQKYWAEDGIFFDEKGRTLDKAALVKDITPMPRGYTGQIRIAKVQSRIFGNSAVLSYDLDESTEIFGQRLSARFHGTDTWLYRNRKWQIVSGHVSRYYEDPAPVQLDESELKRYVGLYELAPGETLTVTLEEGQLVAERKNRPKFKLVPEAPGIFFRPGVEGRRLFRYASDGSVVAMIDRRNNQDLIWKKVQ